MGDMELVDKKLRIALNYVGSERYSTDTLIKSLANLHYLPTEYLRQSFDKLLSNLTALSWAIKIERICANTVPGSVIRAVRVGPCSSNYPRDTGSYCCDAELGTSKGSIRSGERNLDVDLAKERVPWTEELGVEAG